jgi:hypothetical protein
MGLFRAIGDTADMTTSQRLLGLAATDRGDYATGHAWFAASLAGCTALGDRQGIATCLIGFADLAAAMGRPAHALRLAGAVERARQASILPITREWQGRLARATGAARALLPVDEAARSWEEGTALSLEEASAEATALVSEGRLAGDQVVRAGARAVETAPGGLPATKPPCGG